MGLHHACAIDSNSSLRCDGHNSHGQSEAGRAQREPGWRRRARAATPDIGWRMREENPDRGARWTEGGLDLPLRPLGELLAGEEHEDMSARRPPDGVNYRDVCAGEAHTCALENVSVACWGANYSALDVGLLNLQLQYRPPATGGGPPKRLMCGRRFVCAVLRVPLSRGEAIAASSGEAIVTHGEQALCTGASLKLASTEDGEIIAKYVPIEGTWVRVSAEQKFKKLDAGWEHVCGVTPYGQVECVGDAPFIRAEEASRNYYDVRCGADHTCLTLVSATGSGPSNRVSCFSGLPAHGARAPFWLAEFLEAAPWTRTRAMSFANSIACYVDHKGKVVCAGEPGQHMAGIRPPAPLQPERIDLIERGLAFSDVQCNGAAVRNGSLVDLGDQFCCGLDHHKLVRCWGTLPPHMVGVNDTCDTDVTCSHEEGNCAIGGLRGFGGAAG